jgi:hypothetical protein
MYAGVPITIPVRVNLALSSFCFDIPKSIILTRGEDKSPTKKTFSGFISR